MVNGCDLCSEKLTVLDSIYDYFRFYRAGTARLGQDLDSEGSNLGLMLIDIHTHVYLPRYASMLRARSSVPRIFKRDTGDERLLILDNEPSGGRPVGPQYWDRREKLNFMDRHGIQLSVLRYLLARFIQYLQRGLTR